MADHKGQSLAMYLRSVYMYTYSANDYIYTSVRMHTYQYIPPYILFFQSMSYIIHMYVLDIVI